MRKSKFEKLKDVDWLKNRYIDYKWSSTKIAKEIGCSSSSVSKALKKNNISLRNSSEAQKFRDNKSKYSMLNDKDWLYQEYVMNKKSINMIADIVGVKTSNSVRQSLIRHNIKVRSVHEGLAVKRKNDFFIMDLPVIEGGLLGDAYMICHNKDSDNSYPYFAKNNIHYEHVLFVAEKLFGNYGEERVFDHCCNDNFSYQVRSYAYQNLQLIYDKWYPKSNNYKKVVPSDLKLTSEHVLHWFMDDGYSCLRKRKYKNGWTQKKKQVNIGFCSESFTKEENEYLISELLRLGVRSTLRKVKSGTGWRIRISSKDINAFFDLIGDCPIECFKYKWKRL